MPNAEDDDDDDVLGNDRNALRLKPEVARIMGNEARLLFHKGLWVISLVCLWIAGRARGSEVKLGDISHIHIMSGAISTVLPMVGCFRQQLNNGCGFHLRIGSCLSWSKYLNPKTLIIVF